MSFTIHDAIKHYKGNPVVMCLADEEICKIDSSTIHSTTEKGHDDPFIWAYSMNEGEETGLNSILLYAPGKLDRSIYYKSPIISS